MNMTCQKTKWNNSTNFLFYPFFLSFSRHQCQPPSSSIFPTPSSSFFPFAINVNSDLFNLTQHHLHQHHLHHYPLLFFPNSGKHQHRHHQRPLLTLTTPLSRSSPPFQTPINTNTTIFSSFPNLFSHQHHRHRRPCLLPQTPINTNTTIIAVLSSFPNLSSFSNRNSLALFTISNSQIYLSWYISLNNMLFSDWLLLFITSCFFANNAFVLLHFLSTVWRQFWIFLAFEKVIYPNFLTHDLFPNFL